MSKSRKSSAGFDGYYSPIDLKLVRDFIDVTVEVQLSARDDGTYDIAMDSPVPLRCWGDDRESEFCRGGFTMLQAAHVSPKRSIFQLRCPKCCRGTFLDFKGLSALIKASQNYHKEKNGGEQGNEGEVG